MLFDQEMDLVVLARRFMALPLNEQVLLLRAAWMVGAMRVALFLGRFRAALDGTRQPAKHSSFLAGFDECRLAWAVRSTARCVPGASCLTQALALQRLLARAGRQATLRVGVCRDAPAGFRAHAWVEISGKIVLGDDGTLSRFAPIFEVVGEKA